MTLYPLVVTDDTITSRDELFRYIRIKCGWEVADALESEFCSSQEQMNVADVLRRIRGAQAALNDVADSLQNLSDEVENEINSKAGRRNRQ